MHALILKKKEIFDSVLLHAKTPMLPMNLDNNPIVIASFSFISNIFDFFTKAVKGLQPQTESSGICSKLYRLTFPKLYFIELILVRMFLVLKNRVLL